MYSVSDDFIKAIQSNSRSYFWTGEITTKKGQKYQFENKDIVKGSEVKNTGVKNYIRSEKQRIADKINKED